MAFKRRGFFAVVLAVVCLFLVYQYSGLSSTPAAAAVRGYLPLPFSSAGASIPSYIGPRYSNLPDGIVDWQDGKFHWANVEQHFPPDRFFTLPQPRPRSGNIQHTDWRETDEQKAVRLQRLAAVRGNFTHAWQGYRKYAWLKDEVGPLTGEPKDNFGGWAASLVDGLDTLWIMGLKDEFDEAVASIATIDFSSCSLKELNVFETIIRYMGGLMAAYDLSGGTSDVLLRKILELGEMVYKSFDTPNRMPISRWDFEAAKRGEKQKAKKRVIVAELASFQLEMSRLSQITGDDRFYDTAARVTTELVKAQMTTGIPGLFPTQVDLENIVLNDGWMFTIGGMVDSLYEYLPKTYLLLGQSVSDYKTLYQRAMEPIRRHILYQPMTPEAANIVLAGQVRVTDSTPGAMVVSNDGQAQHLACFAGGMIGLGARAFNMPADMDLALRATWGCAWGYQSAAAGIMPEIQYTLPCPAPSPGHEICEWNETAWRNAVHQSPQFRHHAAELSDADIAAKHIPRGVINIENRAYYLRPEAIESVFILYRLTGDRALADMAWRMFESVISLTKTDIGAASVDDCTNAKAPGWTDKMESYWFAETLKYFYLVFADPDVVSLDDWVLNTEAHPLRRP